MDVRLRHHLIIAAAGAVVFFTALGKPRLWDRDEPRNARCAQEMWERGDWVVPTFNGELRAHKPVLLYWLMIGAYEVLGPTEFAARLWSALLGIGTSLATYQIGRRLFSAEVGFWAGLILATSLNFAVAARAATPDSALIFAITLAMLAYVRGAFPEAKAADLSAPFKHSARPTYLPASLWTWVAVYAAMGLAVLAKGPVGVLLPTATIGLFLLYATLPDARDEGRRRSSQPATRRARLGAWLFRQLRPFSIGRIARYALAMRPLILVAVVLLVAAPWYVAVHVLTDGAWTHEFFFKHNLERASSAMEGHRGPIIYYPLVMLIGFFPWSIFAVPTLLSWYRRTARSSPQRAAYLFAACWVAAYVVVFSLARTKLPNYVLPAYPALALLTAAYLRDWIRGESVVRGAWNYAACGVLGIVGAGILVGVPLAVPTLLPGANVVPLAALGAVLVAGAAAWVVLARLRTAWAAASLGATAVVFATLAFGVALVEVDRGQPSEDLIQAVRDHTEGNPSLAAFRNLEPSIVYYAGQYVPQLINPQQVDEFFQNEASPYLVAEAEDLPALRYSLPDDVTEVARLPRFLKPGEVVVLGKDRIYR